MSSNIKLGGVCVVCVATMWMFIMLYRLLQELYKQSDIYNNLEYSWICHLVLNLTGYAAIIVPGFILHKYLQKTNYFDKISTRPPTMCSRVLHACFGPHGERLEAAPVAAAGGAELVFCAAGLMAAYLVWGLMQEKIMTQEYIVSDGSALRFTDASFLVVCNRLGALLAALARLLAARRALLGAPLAASAPAALSNVLSAWCQYEALHYVSFPTQVLSKSCKVIPVMLMGKLISRNQYTLHEYLTAAGISLGMVLFMLGTHDEYSSGVVGGYAGGFLLSLYLCCDAFTASWQSALFRRHALSPLQLLLAVSATGVVLAGAPLTAPPAALALHPPFVRDCLLLAASSAAGQLLIYRTIAGFGAVVFVIIMTLRQAVSILLSCIVYGHAVSWWGAAGVSLVFLSVLLRARPRGHTKASESPARSNISREPLIHKPNTLPR